MTCSRRCVRHPWPTPVTAAPTTGTPPPPGPTTPAGSWPRPGPDRHAAHALGPARRHDDVRAGAGARLRHTPARRRRRTRRRPAGFRRRTARPHGNRETEAIRVPGEPCALPEGGVHPRTKLNAPASRQEGKSPRPQERMRVLGCLTVVAAENSRRVAAVERVECVPSRHRRTGRLAAASPVVDTPCSVALFVGVAAWIRGLLAAGPDARTTCLFVRHERQDEAYRRNPRRRPTRSTRCRTCTTHTRTSSPPGSTRRSRSAEPSCRLSPRS